MKKLAALLLLTGMMTGSFACAAAVSNAPEKGFISVNTTANTEVAPDVAEISIAVETYDSKSMQKATKENKDISDKVYAELKSMINPANGDFIKTADFNAVPLYTYSSNNKKSFDKYQVSNSIIVHTKSIDKVGTMIDKAISLGATNINNLTFSVSNYDKQCNDLLAIAAKKATERVNILAKASNQTLAGIKTMDTSCSTNSSSRVQYRFLAKNMAAMDSASGAVQESASVPIQGGLIKIYANLNASYFVK